MDIDPDTRLGVQLFQEDAPQKPRPPMKIDPRTRRRQGMAARGSATILTQDLGSLILTYLDAANTLAATAHLAGQPKNRVRTRRRSRALDKDRPSRSRGQTIQSH